jgi:hypothetical protein
MRLLNHIGLKVGFRNGNDIIQLKNFLQRNRAEKKSVKDFISKLDGRCRGGSWGGLVAAAHPAAAAAAVSSATAAASAAAAATAAAEAPFPGAAAALAAWLGVLP